MIAHGFQDFLRKMRGIVYFEIIFTDISEYIINVISISRLCFGNADYNRHERSLCITSIQMISTKTNYQDIISAITYFDTIMTGQELMDDINKNLDKLV